MCNTSARGDGTADAAGPFGHRPWKNKITWAVVENV